MAGHSSGNPLADQTCPHFPKWVDHLVASLNNRKVVVWVFHHDLRVETLPSWFNYCVAGEKLLQELTNMQRDDGLVKISTLALLKFADDASSRKMML